MDPFYIDTEYSVDHVWQLRRFLYYLGLKNAIKDSIYMMPFTAITVEIDIDGR